MVETYSAPIVPSAAAAMMALEKVIQKVTDAASPDHPAYGMMKKKGRFIFNHTHPLIKWKVKYHQPDSEVYVPNLAMQAPQENLYEEATLPVRGRYFARSIDYLNRLYSQGSNVKLDFWQELLKEGPKALLRNMCQDLYQIDGNATGYTYQFHGLPSFLGTTGSAINDTEFFYPSDTYAGLSTVLTNYGGSHSYFPLSASPKACFFSPILSDYNATGLQPLPSGQTAHSWTTQWRDAMSRASTYLMQRQGKKVDTWVCPPDLWLNAKKSIELSEGVYLERGADSSLAISLGYKSFTYDGVDVVQDQDVPTGVCYGLHWESITFVSPQAQLVARFKEFEAERLNEARYFALFGNFRIETPAHVIELKNQTDAS